MLGSLGVTALIGIFSGGFLALIISVILIFLFVRKIQKTAASHTGSPPISRPVSMENGSVPVSHFVKLFSCHCLH